VASGNPVYRPLGLETVPVQWLDVRSVARVATFSGVIGLIVPILIVGGRYAVLECRPGTSTFIMNTLALMQPILWPTSFMIGPVSGDGRVHYYVHEVLPSVCANVALYALMGTVSVSICRWCRAWHVR
jgi:hypothetical protein